MKKKSEDLQKNRKKKKTNRNTKYRTCRNLKYFKLLFLVA